MKQIILNLVLVCACATGVRAEHGYTAHEWGTFTSVQGGDGQLLEWSPLQSSVLPKFVHNQLLFTKVSLVTLQRMETPVIYFHSDHDFQVDVHVRFPKGTMTEWYPQANSVERSALAWTNLSVLADSPKRTEILPQDKLGSHYFAAREAASQWVRAGSPQKSEFEKFLFYRGAGSFQTPLRASIDGVGSIAIENTGAQKLSHLFLVSIHDGRGSLSEVDSLESHSAKTPAAAGDMPLAKLQTKIAERMALALASEGLQTDEAQAMVDTWKDSWFTDEGERVLYILPRAWTDEILPLTLSPAPEKLVRVMVGRAEIITPRAVAQLRQNLLKAEAGDDVARVQSQAQLKALGRFAGAAMRLVHLKDKPATASIF